jgi:hypothetical protein
MPNESHPFLSSSLRNSYHLLEAWSFLEEGRKKLNKMFT